MFDREKPRVIALAGTALLISLMRLMIEKGQLSQEELRQVLAESASILLSYKGSMNADHVAAAQVLGGEIGELITPSA
jgi:hypothetical protein